MANGSEFRTCPITGKKVFAATQNLVWINAVTAVVFILVGGIMALLVGLTRWPAVHLLSADLFYRFLTAHGLNMQIGNAVTAVVFILVGGIMALLVGLTRWPAVHLLSADLFYRFLTAHGLNM